MKNSNVTFKMWFLALVCVGGLFSFLAKIQKNNDTKECSIEMKGESSEISQNRKTKLNFLKKFVVWTSVER